MKKITRAAIYLIFAITLFCATSCGTLMYPERRGQPRGAIDPTVVIMDGVLLFFFVIPGVVAFFVDFHNNSIYLSEAESDADLTNFLQDPSRMRVVHLGKSFNKSNIELLLSAETGKKVDLSQTDWDLVTKELLPDHLAEPANNNYSFAVSVNRPSQRKYYKVHNYALKERVKSRPHRQYRLNYYSSRTTNLH